MKKPEELGDHPTEKPGWRCLNCDTDNNDEFDKCEICGEARPGFEGEQITANYEGINMSNTMVQVLAQIPNFNGEFLDEKIMKFLKEAKVLGPLNVEKGFF